MITIEKFSIMTISFKIFNSKRKYIKNYRYIRTYGSLPLQHISENSNRNSVPVPKKNSYFMFLDVHHVVPS
jgi:hypothetical protein